MHLLSVQDRINFVHSLQIDAPSRLLAAASDAPQSANVDAGSLVSFTSGVSDQHRSDALNSTLLAQLNSDTKFDRFDHAHVIDWYKNYASVLGKVGWTMQDFQFQNYQASGSTFSIDTAITQIVTAFLPASEVAVVRATLNALSSLDSDDPWYTVWDRSSHSADGGNFQLSTCTDHDGAVNTLVMQMSAYSFTTTETTTRFLWTNYHSSSTELHYATQTATLNEDVYSQVRSAIIAKLGAKASQFIGTLNI